MVRTKRQHRDFLLSLLKLMDPKQVYCKDLPSEDVEDAVRTYIKYLLFDKEASERETQGWIELWEDTQEKLDAKGGDCL